MKRLIIISIFISIFLNIAYADVGSFDIIKIEINKIEYYLSIYSTGTLQNHDLCYYSWDGEYKNEVEVILKKSFKRQDSIELFKELHIINIEKLLDFPDDLNKNLFILKKSVKMSKEYIFNNLRVLDAFNGSTYGMTYTPELQNNDNIWINDYPIEKLFNITDYELCSMSVYCIKGNISKQESNRIRSVLDSFLKKYERKKFKKELKRLYKKHIFMIGFCSC